MIEINYPNNRYTGDKPWMNYDWLYNEYVIKDRSTQEIADEYGCVRNTIQQWLAKFKIKKDFVKRNRKNKYEHITKDYLIEEHLNKNKPLRQIAEENKISFDTIKRYCINFGIDYWLDQHPVKLSKQQEEDICYLYENNNMSTNKLGEMFNVTHSTIKKVLLRNNIHIRSCQEAQILLYHETLNDLYYDTDYLNDLYWNQGYSCKEIGKMLGYNGGTIRRQMKRLGLKTKNNAESKIGMMTGDKHPNWKGGITPLYLLLREFFTINLAPIAVKRDKYTCQLCGTKKGSLHVHHIKHFKDIVYNIINNHPELDVNKDKEELYKIITNDKDFLDIDNLITYCKDCHLFKIHGYKRKDN